MIFQPKQFRDMTGKLRDLNHYGNSFSFILINSISNSIYKTSNIYCCLVSRTIAWNISLWKDRLTYAALRFSYELCFNRFWWFDELVQMSVVVIVIRVNIAP